MMRVVVVNPPGRDAESEYFVPLLVVQVLDRLVHNVWATEEVLSVFVGETRLFSGKVGDARGNVRKWDWEGTSMPTAIPVAHLISHIKDTMSQGQPLQIFVFTRFSDVGSIATEPLSETGPVERLVVNAVVYQSLSSNSLITDYSANLSNLSQLCRRSKGLFSLVNSMARKSLDLVVADIKTFESQEFDTCLNVGCINMELKSHPIGPSPKDLAPATLSVTGFVPPQPDVRIIGQYALTPKDECISMYDSLLDALVAQKSWAIVDAGFFRGTIRAQLPENVLVLDLQRQTSALEPSSSEELKTWELSEIEQNETLVDSLLANFPLSAKDLEAMITYIIEISVVYRASRNLQSLLSKLEKYGNENPQHAVSLSPQVFRIWHVLSEINSNSVSEQTINGIFSSTSAPTTPVYVFSTEPASGTLPKRLSVKRKNEEEPVQSDTKKIKTEIISQIKLEEAVIKPQDPRRAKQRSSPPRSSALTPTIVKPLLVIQPAPPLLRPQVMATSRQPPVILPSRQPPQPRKDSSHSKRPDPRLITPVLAPLPALTPTTTNTSPSVSNEVFNQLLDNIETIRNASVPDFQTLVMSLSSGQRTILLDRLTQTRPSTSGKQTQHQPPSRTPIDPRAPPVESQITPPAALVPQQPFPVLDQLAEFLYQYQSGSNPLPPELTAAWEALDEASRQPAHFAASSTSPTHTTNPIDRMRQWALYLEDHLKSIAPTEARDSNSDWGTSKWKEIEEEERLVGAILTKSLGDAAQSDIEVKAKLPKLTLKKFKSSNPILSSLQKTSYHNFLDDQFDDLLSTEDLLELWNLLSEVSEGITEHDKRLNFIGFQTIAESLPSKYARYFRPSVYMRLVSDLNGNITFMQLYNYIGRRASLLQARLELGRYDHDMDGNLTEEELQKYIIDLMPTLRLSSIKPSFHKFYLCTAARKFFFFLDPMRRGKIAIEDVILSPILGELFALRDELPKELERQNWFSAQSSLLIYGNFLNLDSDHNGLLSRKELDKYNGGNLNPVFLDRIFQELMTYSGEMDYRTFLDFVLALENIHSPSSISFLFKVLDVHSCGVLSEFCVHYFLKGMMGKLQLIGHELHPIDDVINEIFDIAARGQSREINLDELLKCGQGGVIVSMLIDVNGFFAYEQREGSVG